LHSGRRWRAVTLPRSLGEREHVAADLCPHDPGQDALAKAADRGDELSRARIDQDAARARARARRFYDEERATEETHERRRHGNCQRDRP
jgi:hypothetical protein